MNFSQPFSAPEPRNFSLAQAAPPNRRPLPLLTDTAAECVLSALLQAHKSGGMGALLRQRPHCTRWLIRRYLRSVLSTTGDLMPGEAGREAAISIFLHWSIGLLRPDQAPTHTEIDRACWLDRTSWRPFLALLCHFGYLRVPEFSDRYRRSPLESAADNLCGLWAIGPSTFYRYLDKAKRRLAKLLLLPLSAPLRMSLRETMALDIQARLAAAGTDHPAAWHSKQARHAASQRDPCSALWHYLHAMDAPGFIEILERFRIELAGEPEFDLLIERFAAVALSIRYRFELRLAQAAVLRCRHEEGRAAQVCEEALQLATASGDRLMLGMAYGALGKFHELRDTDKALACFADSADFLRQALEATPPSSPNAEIACAYASALQRLAWLRVMRNDPRAQPVLETANALRNRTPITDDINALLEQTWGEYWRRTRQFTLAIECQHRVLNVFERLRDTRQILSTYNNLSLIYLEAKQFDRAIEYGKRVVDHAAHKSVDIYVVSSAFLNLGAAYFWLTDYGQAIVHYQTGLEYALSANLPVIVNRARYNLAEAHYKRFQLDPDPADEAEGDRHIALVLCSDPAKRDSWSINAAPRLKTEVLGDVEALHHDRMQPEEGLVHGVELAAIHHERTILAVPGAPDDHVRAHLAIANAYLKISTKERETALALMNQHGLSNQFEAELIALQTTFSRELTREKVLLAQWKNKSYGVLTHERANAVLAHVLQTGAINKSTYAQLCQVALATASKHLGTLAERGLLIQAGKGPSTRYVLP